MFKTLKSFKVANKKVLVRCDFNVPLDENGKIKDDNRIKQAIPTIEYLIRHKAKVILMSHMGDPKGAVVENLRLGPVKERLSKYLDSPVFMAADCIGEEVEEDAKEMEPGDVLLLENLRFHTEEEENDPEFAKKLARLGDIYINDAFGCSHRAHASISLIPKYLASGAGLLLEKEITVLNRAIKNPWRPLVAIMGGVKIGTKIKLIKRLLEISDHLIIGGDIANTILIVKNLCVGRPWPTDAIAKEVQRLDLTSTKLHLPVDAVVSADKTGKACTRISAPAKVRKDELLLDIGPESINIFGKIIKEAKMIIFAGPMGLFEEPAFERGTKEIAEVVARNHKAYKIAGGGDTVFALTKYGLTDKFDYVSTGGGAMLSFLADEKLPGLTALENK